NQLQPSPRRPLTGVLELAIRVKDSELIDQVAARLALRADRSGADQLLQAAAYAAQFLEAADPEPHAERRAAASVRRFPRRAIHSRQQLLQRNPLARLLFHRAARACIQHVDDAIMLLQAEERHVCALGVEALTRSDPHAAARMAENLDLLLRALERPLPRSVIRRAIPMLAYAATSQGRAVRLLRWAREKLGQGPARFSHMALLRLTAQLLVRFPELRTKAEQPVIY